jgi:cyclophilin family peptidyl-prolyl cis-trans isomerase
MRAREKTRTGWTGRRVVLCVEALEDRTTPTGNVQVAVTGGTLDIAGDGSITQLSVTGEGDHAALVRTLDGTTTIDGQTGPVYVSGFSDTFIHLGDGNNQINVSGISGEGLYVNLGNGNNTFTDNGASNGGVTFVDAGAGTNTITLSNALFEQEVAVRTAGGNNQINATNIEVVNFSLVANGGTDFFNNQGSTIVFPQMVGTVTTGSRPSTAPTVTLSTADPDPTNIDPLVFTATFSAAVTGFSASGVQVTNGTVTSFTQQNPETYAIEVTPSGQGLVTATVLAGVATDVNGNANAASDPVSLTFNSVVPTLTITSQDTNNTTPIIAGTVSEPDAPVSVTVNGQTYTATVTGNTWAAAVTSALADGTYSVTATSTDAAGNTGTVTSPTGLIIDTVAPATPTLALAAADDDGTVGGFRTTQSTVALTGTAEAGTTVTLSTTTSGNAPGTGPVVATTTAGANGTFTFNNVSLAVGPNSFVVTATDAAGNVSPTFAQTFTLSQPPTVASPIGDQTATAGGSALTFDLSGVYAEADEVVRMNVSYPTGQTGYIDIALFPNQSPQNVANFLSYLNSSSASVNYNGAIFDRLVSGFVLQGGAFKYDSTGTTTATIFPESTTSAAVVSEPSVANTLGTVAMALTGAANTATNEFFFNLADNSANLDTQDGGFTVIGQVMDSGLQTVQSIAQLGTYSGSGQPGAGPFPVGPNANTTNFPTNITAADLATITSATELTTAQKLTFSVVNNTNPTVATASVSGSTLTVNPLVAGTTTITVQATNLDGSTTQTQFQLTVS